MAVSVHLLSTFTHYTGRDRLMFDAVARVLANVAGHAGTLLLLDDLQWAGQDALDLLLSLLRAEPTVPLRVAGAYRDSDAPAGSPLAVTLADLAHTGRVAHHALAPLSPAEAGQLFDLLAGDGAGGAGTDAARARVVRRSGGVPFYVVSLAQAPRQGEPHESAEDAVPWSVAQAVRERVAALPDPAPEVLGAVAIVGRQASVALLTAVTERPEGMALGALERAVRARLLVEQAAGVYHFAHDVIRETVEADLGAGRRTLLHRRVATALEEVPGEPPVEDLAYHYTRSDADDKAVLYLERAGDRAEAQGAHAAAEGYYRELAARLDRLERTHDAARAREKLGAALRYAQRFDAALRVLEGALETYLARGDQPGLGRVVAQIGHAHIDRGMPNQAAERTEAMLRYLDGAEAWQGVAALYKTLALFFVAAGRYQEQLSAAERAGEYGRKAGDRGIVAHAESARGHALLLLGRLDEAVGVLEGAIPLAKAAGDRDCLIGAFGHLASAHMSRGEFDRSRHYIGLTSRAAEDLGSDLLTRVAKLRRALLCLYEGDWTQAHADLDWAASLDEQVESPWVLAYPVFALGALCFFEGEWEQAARRLHKSITMATRAGVRDMKALRWAWIWLAELALRKGRPEEIREARDQLAALLDRSGQQELDVTALLPRLAWTHLELGDTDLAATLATESVERARTQGHRVALVDALWVRGMVATRRRQWGEATQALEEGLALARGMRYPYAEACMLETDGLMRRARGEGGAARARIEAAVALFTCLGARKDVARVEQLLAGF